MKEPRYFVYGLVDPRDGSLRYVGKSSRGMQRPKHHFFPSQLKENTHKAHWMKSVLASGFRPLIVILEEFTEESPLADAEQFYISYFRYLGCRLTNATDGGDGASGALVSAATRAKMSATRKGRKQSEAHKAARSEALLGHTVSEETRQKIRAGNLGNKTSLGRRVSDETRRKISESLKKNSTKGKKLSLETRARMKIAALEREARKRQQRGQGSLPC